MTTDTQRRRREAAYRKGFEDGRAERLAGSRAVVKPLEWKNNSSNSLWTDELMFGVYYVAYDQGDGWLVERGQFLSEAGLRKIAFGPKVEVLAAAQSDYEPRILSALTEPDGEAHPDDLAVDRFAAAMKAKLAKKRNEGRGGWDNREECTAEHLSYLLIQHCLKGGPLDVGNLAMMLHQRGDRIVIDDETASIMGRQEQHAATVDDLWQELCNYDDRTSPADYPDMCLISRDELADFVSRATPPASAIREALEASLETMQRYKRAGHGDDVFMSDLCQSIRKAEAALAGAGQ